MGAGGSGTYGHRRRGRAGDAYGHNVRVGRNGHVSKRHRAAPREGSDGVPQVLDQPQDHRNGDDLPDRRPAAPRLAELRHGQNPLGEPVPAEIGVVDGVEVKLGSCCPFLMPVTDKPAVGSPSRCRRRRSLSSALRRSTGPASSNRKSVSRSSRPPATFLAPKGLIGVLVASLRVMSRVLWYVRFSCSRPRAPSAVVAVAVRVFAFVRVGSSVMASAGLGLSSDGVIGHLGSGL